MIELGEFEKYKGVISGEGREALKLTIANFRNAYGENWLKEFQMANPDFAEIVSLVANFNAESAFVRLKQIVEYKIDTEISAKYRFATKLAALTYLDYNRAEVFKLHAELQEEIHKPRF